MTHGDWNWIASTEQLQIEAYGNDLRAMEGEERDRAFTTHTLAALDELHEALAETHWKPWDKKNVGGVNKDAFKGEIVDALHFVANLLVLAEISEDELWEAYQEKQQRNRDRQAAKGGYDSKANRCPTCKRELDKPGAYITHSFSHDDPSDPALTFQLECNMCRSRFDFKVEEGGALPGTKTA